MSTPSKNVQIIVYVQIDGLQLGQMVKINPDTHISNFTQFAPNNFPLPSAYASANIQTLTDILSIIPGDYYTLKYQAAFGGTIDPDNCRCPTDVQIQLNNAAYQTVYTDPNGTKTVNTPTYVDLTNVNLPNSIPVSADVGTYFAKSSGCTTCPNKTMYPNSYMYLRAVIVIDMYSWCTLARSNNIQYAPCFNFIGNWCTQNGGCDQSITTYLQNYCNTQYPNKELDIFNTDFNSQDYQLCACNMPTTDYIAYQQSIDEFDCFVCRIKDRHNFSYRHRRLQCYFAFTNCIHSCRCAFADELYGFGDTFTNCADNFP